MKKILSLVLVLGLLVCTLGVNSISAAPVNQAAKILAENPDYRVMKTVSGEERILDANNMVINQIIVNVDQVLDVDAYNNGEITDFFGVEITQIEALFEEEWIDAIIEKIGYKFSYLITVPFGTDIQSALETLENNEHISAVCQNEHTESASEATYDALTATTGHYDLIGVGYAWDHGFTGSSDVQVAILDAGAGEHSEFDNNMELSWGFNACFEKATTLNGSAADDVTPLNPLERFHGHMVAGIIGADYGDGGVNGICQDVTMIPVLINGELPVVHWGFFYAVVSGVNIINLSWRPVGETAIDLIENTDILLVTSAGNYGQEIIPLDPNGANDPNRFETPKANNLPNVIVVGNSSLDDTKIDNSNYSTTYVDLFAPGEGVKTATYPTGTMSGGGTSAAAPMVAATAALIRSHATHLTAAQVKDLILNNVDVVPALEDYCVTSGRLAIDKIVDALYAEDRDEYSKGDVNGDGAITSMDKMFAQRIAYGTMTPTDDQFYAADVNKDGVVDTTDVDMILGFYYSTCYFPPV